MEDQENNEIKILIDALKYTSNIIVDMTNKLTTQEEKINILENKLNKIQKISMENNLKLKTIDFDKLNEILKSSNKQFIINKKKNNHDNNSDEIAEYIIEKNTSNKICKTNNTNTNVNICNENEIHTQQNMLDEEPKDKDKNKIDKLIGSIVKRKNILNQMINDNKEKSILTEYNCIENTKKNIENSGLDLTIKTGTNKSENIDTKTYYSNTICNEIEYDKIADAQNNDLNKANNILKQIRRRGNFARKI